MARRKSYSKRSAGARKRIDRAIAKTYGTTKPERERALRDLREGRWTPFARNPENRVPTRLRDRIIDVPRDWATLAWQRIRGYFGDRLRWKGEKSDQHVLINLSHANTDALIAIVNATDNELDDWASRQPIENEPPADYPEDMGYFDGKGKWHNILWYH